MLMYIYQLYSLDLSHSPLPPMSTYAFSLHLYSCPTYRFIYSIFLFIHIYELICYICFPLSELHHFAWHCLGPFTYLQWPNAIPFNGWVIFHWKIFHIFIHFSVSGHLGCFHVLAIAHSASMHIGVHVSFCIMVFCGYMPSSWIIGSYGSSILDF